MQGSAEVDYSRLPDAVNDRAMTDLVRRSRAAIAPER
jgi:hypothetical protein